MKRLFADDDLWYSMSRFERVCLRIVFLCMVGILLVAAPAFGADDPQTTIAFQTQAIKALQDQRNAYLDQSANVQANAAVIIERLQKRVQELEEAAKTKK